MDKMPVFVKIDEYEDVLTLIHNIRRKLDEAKQTLLKINDLKSEEDQLLEHWQGGLDEIEKKVEFIDHSLNQPEQF